MAIGATASTVCALAEFPPSEAGIASGVFNSLRQVGSSLGVAIPAAAFDLVAAGAVGDGATLAGSTAALGSRAAIFALALVAVWLLLPRGRRVEAAQVAGAEGT